MKPRRRESTGGPPPTAPEPPDSSPGSPLAPTSAPTPAADDADGWLSDVSDAKDDAKWTRLGRIPITIISEKSRVSRRGIVSDETTRKRPTLRGEGVRERDLPTRAVVRRAALVERDGNKWCWR